MAEDYQEAEQSFSRFLSARGLRLTATRREVLRAAMELESHFGLPDLESRLARKNVHRATLFRTLPLLVEAGILRRVRERLDHWHYEHTVGHEHHDHLLCINCRRLVEFVSPAIEREQKKLCRQHGFLETSHSFIIRGICPDCRAQGVVAGVNRQSRSRREVRNA